MKLDKLHRVHMLGIGGIGMSALARYFLKQGVEVSGYDRIASEMTHALEKEGAEIHFRDDPSLIPDKFFEHQLGEVLVVRSLAIGNDNRESGFLKEKGCPIRNRAQVLGDVARNYRCIAVAGTHGKTTTSCMLTALLKECGIPCHALLGGVSADFGSNVLLEGEAEHLVVEADEYGRSFLELDPRIAVITAMEEDHMDVYGDSSRLEEAFFEFQRKVSSDGRLFLEEGVPLAPDMKADLTRFGSSEDADLRVANVRPQQGSYVFDLRWKGVEWSELSSGMPGYHNVLDLSAAVGVATLLGAEESELRETMASLKGVRRRFEIRFERKGQVLIDDYAHHPSELKAVIRTARELYPERSITGVFQPHLYSRTRDHAKGFAEALSELDRIVLLPIYPAREEPLPGVGSDMILQRIEGSNKRSVEKGEELLAALKEQAPEVLLVMGAGDISEEVKGMEDLMREMAEKENEKGDGS